MLGIEDPENLYTTAKQLTAVLEKSVVGRDISLSFPTGSIEYDSFGRLLAYVEVGQKFRLNAATFRACLSKA